MGQNLKDRYFNDSNFRVVCCKMSKTRSDFIVGKTYNARYWMGWYDKNNTIIEVTGDDGITRVSSMDNFKYIYEVRDEKINAIFK
jgi:hypothetical protein